MKIAIFNYYSDEWFQSFKDWSDDVIRIIVEHTYKGATNITIHKYNG